MTVEGVVFDPRVHEAVAAFESEEVDEEIVSEEIIPGYTYGYKILRPAQVQVMKPKQESTPKEEGTITESPVDDQTMPKGMSVQELSEKIDMSEQDELEEEELEREE